MTEESFHGEGSYPGATREEQLNRKAAGWPDYYFAPYLLAQDLKTRD